MCGIVGLFRKDTKLEADLGRMLQGMLATMCERGPDSAGFAVYGREVEGVKLTLRGDARTDHVALANAIGKAIGEMLKDLSGRKPADLLRERRDKFLAMGTKGLAA